MRKLSILISATSFLFLAGCSNKTIYKSLWQPSTLTVGECNDYWFTDMDYSTKAKMLYGITNDDQNLYVSLKITDKSVQRKIILTGLTYWIDNTGKGKEQLGITFPMKQTKQKNRSNVSTSMRQQKADHSMSKDEIRRFNERYINGMCDILITGYNGDPEPSIRGNKSISGINALLRMDTLQVLHYEMQIPLDMIFDNPQEFLSDSSSYFSYAFETGYLEMSLLGTESRAGGGGGKGSGGGGGRGGGGGGSRGSRGGGQSSNMSPEQMATMQEMTQARRFKVKRAILSNKVK